MFDSKLLSQRLLLSRYDLKMDQLELAAKSGVSNSYISDIERGRARKIGVDVVFALAEALAISPAYLLGLTDSPTGESDAKILAEQSADYVVAEVDGPEERRIIRSILDDLALMTPEQQRMVMAFLHAMHQIQDGELPADDTHRGKQ